MNRAISSGTLRQKMTMIYNAISSDRLAYLLEHARAAILEKGEAQRKQIDDEYRRTHPLTDAQIWEKVQRQILALDGLTPVEQAAIWRYTQGNLYTTLNWMLVDTNPNYAAHGLDTQQSLDVVVAASSGLWKLPIFAGGQVYRGSRLEWGQPLPDYANQVRTHLQSTGNAGTDAEVQDYIKAQAETVYAPGSIQPYRQFLSTGKSQQTAFIGPAHPEEEALALVEDSN